MKYLSFGFQYTPMHSILKLEIIAQFNEPNHSIY